MPRVTQPLLRDADTTTQFVHASVPALARFGIRVTSVAPGSVHLVMPIDGNANHLGTMYAGALFAIAELPGGLLPWTVLPAGNIVPIAKHAELSFLRPARSDVTVAAELDPAQLTALAQAAAEAGKSDFTLHLSVRDTQDREVASSTTVTQLRLLQP